MDSCILHVGAPKTGTTSIQESLRFGLDDPAFRYITLGGINACYFLELLFSERPEEFWVHRLKGTSASRLQSMRRDHEARFRRVLCRARQRSQTPILSAEHSWEMPPASLERLQDFLREEGFEAQVVAYLRPIKSFAESWYQQQVKWGDLSPESVIRSEADGVKVLTSDSRKLATLAQIFGAGRLIVRPFVRSALFEGCAVRDFCQTLGIRFHPDAVIRSNESLSLDAVRFLSAYNRFIPGANRTRLGDRFLLIHALEALNGDPVRFHSELMSPLAEEMEREVANLQAGYGIYLAEDLKASDRGPCIREEADLFRFNQASLDWLAAQSGSPRIQAGHGEAVAREVARQVDRLRRRPLLKIRWAMLTERLRNKLHWIRHGD